MESLLKTRIKFDVRKNVHLGQGIQRGICGTQPSKNLEDYQNTLKWLASFFLSNPVPFNGQSYQTQKGLGTSDQLLFRLQNKFRKIPLLVIYHLT